MDFDSSALVEKLIKQLNESYVFPDRSAQAEKLLRLNLAEGSYNLLLGPELCDRLSADLLKASGDKHLRLLWHDSARSSSDEAQLVAELREQFRLANQGIRRVERLLGNIGLIELTIIPEACAAGLPLAAAMQLVQYTHALILDLREAIGGAPDGIAFLCSFFFPDGDVHLSDVVQGPKGPTRQYWTSGYVPGPRYLDRPVFVLTSGRTFSGGEELAYDLKALGRATVVGETTRGGAHPVSIVSLGEHIELRLPVARSVNPVTGNNWEAVGVEPDLRIPASSALHEAVQAALKKIVSDAGLPDSSRAEARRVLDQSSKPIAN